MWENLPHPLLTVAIMIAVSLLAYPVATWLSDALRPRFEDFLDRRDDRKYKISRDMPAAVAVSPVNRPEKPVHLVSTPEKGTEVILLADSPYLLGYHGARAGQRGTVTDASRLNPEDNGVLVDWGTTGDRSVRMDLHELRLASDA